MSKSKISYYSHVPSMEKGMLHVYEIVMPIKGYPIETLVCSTYKGLESSVGIQNVCMFGIDDWNKMPNYKKISKDAYDILRLLYA